MNVVVVVLSYLIMWIITARVLFAMSSRDGYSFAEGRKPEQWRDDDVFAATAMGFFWPVVLGLAIVVSPFLAVAWLIQRPTKAEHSK